MTKEEKIKEFIELCEGLAISNDSPHEQTIIDFINSLQCENNNGWIKIESEADLPLSGDLYLCKLAINAWDNEDYIYCLMKDFHKSVPSKLNRALEYTHYQSIVKPKPPLF